MLEKIKEIIKKYNNSDNIFEILEKNKKEIRELTIEEIIEINHYQVTLIWLYKHYKKKKFDFFEEKFENSENCIDALIEISADWDS